MVGSSVPVAQTVLVTVRSGTVTVLVTVPSTEAGLTESVASVSEAGGSIRADGKSSGGTDMATTERGAVRGLAAKTAVMRHCDLIDVVEVVVLSLGGSIKVNLSHLVDSDSVVHGSRSIDASDSSAAVVET